MPEVVPLKPRDRWLDTRFHEVNMKIKTFLALLFATITSATAQNSQQPVRLAAPLARHLVMFTRPGPAVARLREHMAEARAHQALYERLAAEGHTIAGGAF